jgi:sec-independent protein translocase protein TatA
MLGNIGPLEVLVVLIIALIVFGPKRLPELGSSLGRGIREFRDSLSAEKPDGAQAKRLEDPGSGAGDAEEQTEHEVLSDKRA